MGRRERLTLYIYLAVLLPGLIFDDLGPYVTSAVDRFVVYHVTLSDRAYNCTFYLSILYYLCSINQ